MQPSVARAASTLLRVSPNRRYLVDQRGAPFFVHGEAAWSLLVALAREEVERYLSDRARRGVNTIIVNLIEHKFGGPRNHYGTLPFMDVRLLSGPIDAYFDHAAWVISRASEKGIRVLLAPLYLGLEGTDEGWYNEVVTAGPRACGEWGRFVGKRYERFDNIVWLMAGDRDPGPAYRSLEAVVAGIREYDRRHLMTADAAPEQSPVDVYGEGGWLDLNNTYTYGIVHRRLLADYGRSPIAPFFLKGTSYEGEHNASPLQIRRQAYWALLCGACGQVFGNRPIWLFGPGWEDALDSPGSKDMMHLRALVDSVPWHRLVPDVEHRFVTDGLGEFHGLDFLAAAYTTDRSTLVAYVPSPRTFTVDMTQIRANSVTAWWFDPKTGGVAPGGGASTDRPVDFRPPAGGDWVLVLDDEKVDRVPPGAPPRGRAP